MLNTAGTPTGPRLAGGPDERDQCLREIADNVEQALLLVDCTDWRVLYVSAAYERLWGRSRQSLLDGSSSLLDAVHPDDRKANEMTDPRRFFSSDEDLEYRIVRPDGEVRWIRTRTYPVSDGGGRVYRMASSSEDITERKHAEDHLVHVALHDPLTGLPNRAAVMNRLKRAVDRAQRQSTSAFTLLFVDMDRFKTINDTLGHAQGDELLRLVSRRLEQCVRPEDMVGRFGGDEFTILLHQTPSAADAARVARRILERFEAAFELAGQEVFTSVSIGIVPSAGYQGAGEMLRDVDQAMYRAKTERGARYQVFDAEMHAAAVARLQLESDLRRGIEQGEFVLHHQPLVSLSTGRVVGSEALVRWQHPQLGTLLPSHFIGIAEETGIIAPIGWWVLGEACQQLCTWSSRHPDWDHLAVSVNVSGRQFAQRDFATRVAECLDGCSLDPGRLKLEFTEGVIVDDAEAALAKFAQLKELGVRVQIDDFGTGYSSLSYLDRMPVDTLKIDASFVRRIGQNGEGAEIARTIIALGHNLGMSVVGEGIETRAQLEHLRALGCDQAQGYLFARPLVAEAMEKLVAEAPTW